MLRQKLQDEMVAALKNKDTFKLNTLRFAIAQVKNKEIEKKAELNDEETLVVLKKLARELKESILAFEKAGRSELVDENKKQLQLVSSYLPAEISDAALKNEVEKIVKENQEIYNKNPKAIIGIVIRVLKNKADSQRIVKILQEITK